MAFLLRAVSLLAWRVQTCISAIGVGMERRINKNRSKLNRNEVYYGEQ